MMRKYRNFQELLSIPNLETVIFKEPHRFCSKPKKWCKKNCKHYRATVSGRKSPKLIGELFMTIARAKKNTRDPKTENTTFYKVF